MRAFALFLVGLPSARSKQLVNMSLLSRTGLPTGFLAQPWKDGNGVFD